MLTGLWNLKDIQNSRQNRSKNKLVREKAETRAHESCSLLIMGSWRGDTNVRYPEFKKAISMSIYSSLKFELFISSWRFYKPLKIFEGLLCLFRKWCTEAGGGEGMELLRSWGSLFLSFVIEVLNLRESKWTTQQDLMVSKISYRKRKIVILSSVATNVKDRHGVWKFWANLFKFSCYTLRKSPPPPN